LAFAKLATGEIDPYSPSTEPSGVLNSSSPELLGSDFYLKSSYNFKRYYFLSLT
jgi:hypothetical protein